MRGGFRPGAGRPPGSKDGVKRCRRVQYAQNEHVELVLSEPEPQAVTNYSGQEWLRLVINDSSADPIRRDRAAMAMANIEARAAQALGKKAAADGIGYWIAPWCRTRTNEQPRGHRAVDVGAVRPQL